MINSRQELWILFLSQPEFLELETDNDSCHFNKNGTFCLRRVPFPDVKLIMYLLCRRHVFSQKNIHVQRTQSTQYLTCHTRHNCTKINCTASVLGTNRNSTMEQLYERHPPPAPFSDEYFETLFINMENNDEITI